MATRAMAKAAIKLVPQDPDWEREYQITKRAIQSACGDLVLDVVHIGSTAIAGIAAKPIVDILVRLRTHSDGLLCVEPMAALGFDYRGNGGISGRHYYRRGEPHTHHVHMYATDHPDADRYIRFRDYLRANRDCALEYEALKQQLAAKFGSNTLAYSNAKYVFCRRIDGIAQAQDVKSK